MGENRGESTKALFAEIVSTLASKFSSCSKFSRPSAGGLAAGDCDGCPHGRHCLGCDRGPVCPQSFWRQCIGVAIQQEIALNQVGAGLLLVLAFSLGLATVLAGLGLALVYAKQWFERIPGKLQLTGMLPAMSAAAITLIGIGISAQAVINLASG